jgi:chitinase
VSTCQPGNNVKRGKAPKACKKPDSTLYKTMNPVVTEHPISTRICDGNKWPQACLHYSSVIRVNGRASYNPLTCPESSRGTKKARQGGTKYQVVDEYNAEHNGQWSSVKGQNKGWMQAAALSCQRDEYPPVGFWQGNLAAGAFVRLINGHDNGGAGRALFPLNVCKHDAKGNLPTSTSDKFSRILDSGGQRTAIYERYLTVTIAQLSIEFSNMPNLADDGILDNKCFPSVLRNDPGFALMLRDSWYNGHAADKVFGLANYLSSPDAAVIGNNVPQANFFKRDSYFDPDEIILDDGNSTRKATDEELAEEFGFYRCDSSDCKKELNALGVESPIIVAPPRTKAVDVPAATTSVMIPTTTTQVSIASAGSGAQDKWMRMMPRPTSESGQIFR